MFLCTEAEKKLRNQYTYVHKLVNSIMSKKKERERRGVQASKNQLHKHFYTSISRCMTSELIDT